MLKYQIPVTVIHTGMQKASGLFDKDVLIFKSFGSAAEHEISSNLAC